MSPRSINAALTNAEAAELAAGTDTSAGRRSRWRRRYLLPMLGGAVVMVWALAALLAPWITSYAPDTVHVAGRLAAPSAAHWLGTDELGRDVLTRVIYGARTSLTVGFTVVLIGGAIGTLIGAVAAYARGFTEEILMRATDLMFCFPPIILAMAIAAALGIGTRNTVIAMLVVWWPKFARLARSLVLGQRSLEYVAAARSIGFSNTHILFRQIVPNALGPLVVLMTLDPACLSWVSAWCRQRRNGARWCRKAVNSCPNGGSLPFRAWRSSPW
jgi:peptide/nickel transport system permease protein